MSNVFNRRGAFQVVRVQAGTKDIGRATLLLPHASNTAELTRYA